MNNSRGAGGRLRLGFVPLLDAAPIIAAKELGYFAEEGLTVSLHRQIGWGNVRDKLTYGHIDASHALLGMPAASLVGAQWFSEPLVGLMALGSGGNGITISRNLVEHGVRSGVTLSQWVKGKGPGRKLMFAHVFGCSMHHYLLREWLWSNGLEPGEDVGLCVVPPPQMAGQMKEGALDGFCAGEPWNTLAIREGFGRLVIRTTDIMPEHPEKVLAVSRAWLEHNGALAMPLVRAVLRGCEYCGDEGRRGELSRILAKPEYLGAPAEMLLESMGGSESRQLGETRPGGPAWPVEGTFPSPTHAAWFVEQMIRWGHAPADVDVMDVARRCVDATAYREAAVSLGWASPTEEFPPMRLRHGWFDPTREGRILSSAIEKV